MTDKASAIRPDMVKPVKNKLYVSIERLREALHYDPVTGLIMWKINRVAGQYGKTFNRRIGDFALRKDEEGYFAFALDGKKIKVHRAGWALHYGEWPTIGVDHKNCIRTDNRIENLRLANDHQNGANRSLMSNNTSGRKGVSWDKRSNRWKAAITVRGRKIYLGSHVELDDAYAAYVAASKHHFGEFSYEGL